MIIMIYYDSVLTGKRLRALRQERELTWDDLVSVYGLGCRTAVGKLEIGSGVISIHTLLCACAFYDVSADYLLGFEDERATYAHGEYRDSIEQSDYNPDAVQPVFAERFCYVKEQYDLSITQIAVCMNVKNSIVNSCMLGKQRMSTNLVYSVCKSLGVSADFMLGLSDKCFRVFYPHLRASVEREDAVQRTIGCHVRNNHGMISDSHSQVIQDRKVLRKRLCLFAERLLKFRGELGLSETEFAEKLGFTPYSVMELERCRYTPSIDMMLSLYQTYGVCMDYMYGFTDHPVTVEQHTLDISVSEFYERYTCRLRQIREHLGYTSTELAYHLGVIPLTVQRNEANDLKKVYMPYAMRFSEVFGVSLDYILGFSEVFRIADRMTEQTA